MDLKIKFEQWSDGAWIVWLHGSLDSLTDWDCQKELFALLDRGAKHVLLQMEGVKYISSSGLGVLFEVKKRLESTGGFFGLYKPLLAVQRVLQIVKMENMEVTPANVESTNPFFQFIPKEEENKEEQTIQKED